MWTAVRYIIFLISSDIASGGGFWVLGFRSPRGGLVVMKAGWRRTVGGRMVDE